MVSRFFFKQERETTLSNILKVASSLMGFFAFHESAHDFFLARWNLGTAVSPENFEASQLQVSSERSWTTGPEKNKQAEGRL